MNKKKMKIGIVAVIFVVALVVVLAITKKELQLPKLEVEDISKVYNKRLDAFNAEKVDLDIEEFLRYYNQIDELRNNKEDAGTTPSSKIVIELNNGEEISIHNSGDQFQVSFEEGDDRFQYWGKQQGIANILEHGVYGLD